MNLHSWHDPHMIRAGQSLFRALYFTLGVFLFLSVIFHIGGALYVSHIATKSIDNVQAGVAQDLSYLKEQGDAVANNNLLQKYLIEQNSEKLIEITKKEVFARKIGLMGVADKDGILLSRTKSVGSLGNNAFITTPHGRAVDRSGVVESIEISGFDPTQLLMTTGRKIIQDDQMIGALFANYLMDDAYAIRFRDNFLSYGVEVAFYTSEFGIYGNSFSDIETRKLINSYFHSSSEWIKNGSSKKTISFNNNDFYFIENIVFPGLEQSPGGALIFIPHKDISDILNLVTTLLTLCTFIFFASRHHMHARGEERGWRYYVLFIFVSIPVIALSAITLHLQNIGYLKLERIPYTLYNSTIRIQPEFGIYDMDFEQRFSIVVDTGDEAINAVDIKLVFDPQAIEVKALEVVSPTCSYVIENLIDASVGEANFTCVLFKSGGERGSLKIVDVVVTPRHTGTFTLSFDKENTKVLASDGLGTNVLRMSQSGSYRVDNFDPTLYTATDGTVDNTTRSFVVFSPTHPNQSRWYNSSMARFVWRGKPGAVYRYAFDSSPDTIPSKKYTTQDPSINVSIPGDGIFYFHLQLAEGGHVAHYRLQADQSPPSIVSIQSSEEKIVEGDVVRFSFEAEDLGSGIQKNYYVDLGNRLFLPIGSQLFIPFLEAGDQKIVLRVYDTAGNYSEKSQIIHVEPRR